MDLNTATHSELKRYASYLYWHYKRTWDALQAIKMLFVLQAALWLIWL